MTRPTPLDRTDNFEILRKRWLSRYMTVQAKSDTKTRTALIQAAEDAYKELNVLTSKSTFSAAVRSAQLRLVMKIVKEVLNDFFKEEIKIITDGHKQSAIAAVVAFGETDRDYLNKAFGSSGDTASFINGQKIQAQISVANLVSRLEQSSQPLSSRVYRSRRLANNWVQRQVNSAIVRNASAQDIAMSVRKSIRPNTAGGVSYAAMRLGRTELNNAFHATSVALAQDRPWVEGMVWHTSTTHEPTEGLVEICDRYNEQLFEVNNVPKKPHPQCRCFVTPQVQPVAVFAQNLTAGVYNDWIRDAA
jgi:hypothetical protein